jgi:hypothetical protein
LLGYAPTSERRSVVTLTIDTLLAAIALICGVLMVLRGGWSRYPLAAIAVICLALTYFL